MATGRKTEEVVEGAEQLEVLHHEGAVIIDRLAAAYLLCTKAGTHFSIDLSALSKELLHKVRLSAGFCSDHCHSAVT